MTMMTMRVVTVMVRQYGDGDGGDDNDDEDGGDSDGGDEVRQQ